MCDPCIRWGLLIGPVSMINDCVSIARQANFRINFNAESGSRGRSESRLSPVRSSHSAGFGACPTLPDSVAPRWAGIFTGEYTRHVGVEKEILCTYRYPLRKHLPPARQAGECSGMGETLDGRLTMGRAEERVLKWSRTRNILNPGPTVIGIELSG